MNKNNNLTILIVDDTPVMLTVLQKFLELEGYSVIAVDNGSEARKIAQEKQPHLILLDIMMPGESGLETCTLLKQNPATVDIPVIFISAITDVSSKVEGFNIGAVDYITKPFEKMEVLARVRLHLKLQMAYKTVIEAQSEKLKQVKEAQESILIKPSDYPQAKFGVSYRPIQEAGGDFYDVIAVSENISGYFVADVSGHDLKSSYLTSALKALIAQNANLMYKPEETMKMMNQVLTTIAPPGKYLTAVYLYLNRLQLQLTCVNAGHPPVIVVDTHGNSQLIESDGDVLGAFEMVCFTPLTRKVARGDRFYLYTDGFIEGFGDNKKTRTEGLVDLCKLCSETKSLAIQEAVDHINSTLFPPDKAQEDDLLLMGVEV